MSVYKRVREFIEGEDAKADDIESEFDNIATTLQGGIDSNNITDGGISAADIATGAVGRSQLASGFKHKVTTGTQNLFIFGGASVGSAWNQLHSLGETPAYFDARVLTAENYAIVFEVRVISLDPTYARIQLVTNSAIPGPVELHAFPVIWKATGP